MRPFARSVRPAKRTTLALTARLGARRGSTRWVVREEVRPRSVVVCELIAAAQAKRMGAGRPLRRPSQREDATGGQLRRGPNGPLEGATFGPFRDPSSLP